jgi:hypothetical protein
MKFVGGVNPASKPTSAGIALASADEHRPIPPPAQVFDTLHHDRKFFRRRTGTLA